jgi:hypothetical protein
VITFFVLILFSWIYGSGLARFPCVIRNGVPIVIATALFIADLYHDHDYFCHLAWGILFVGIADGVCELLFPEKLERQPKVREQQTRVRGQQPIPRYVTIDNPLFALGRGEGND